MIVARRAHRQTALRRQVQAEAGKTQRHQTHACPSLTTVRLVTAGTRLVQLEFFIRLAILEAVIKKCLHYTHARAVLDTFLRRALEFAVTDPLAREWPLLHADPAFTFAALGAYNRFLARGTEVHGLYLLFLQA